MEVDFLKLVIKPTSYQGIYKISWAQFMNFKVLMIVDGPYKGYINGTKLVALASTKYDKPKMLKHWFNNDGTRAFLKVVERVVGLSTAELTYEIRGGNSDFTGTYCHSDIISSIARWASPEFEYLCNKIINKFAIAYIEEIKIKQEEIIANLQNINENNYKNISNLTVENVKIKEINIKLEFENIEKTNKINELTTAEIKHNSELKIVENKLEIATDEYVPPNEDIKKNEDTYIIKLNGNNRVGYEKYTYYVIRCQIYNFDRAIRDLKIHHPNAEILHKIIQPNCVNLFNRVKETYGNHFGSIIYDANYFHVTETFNTITNDEFVIQMFNKMNLEKKELTK